MAQQPLKENSVKDELKMKYAELRKIASYNGYNLVKKTPKKIVKKVAKKVTKKVVAKKTVKVKGKK